MKARLAWLAGGIGVGVAAAYRALRPRPERCRRPRRSAPTRAPRSCGASSPRRALPSTSATEFEAAETPVDEVPDVAPPPEPEPEPESQDLDERRRRVHERAKASARKMRGREPDA